MVANPYANPYASKVYGANQHKMAVTDKYGQGGDARIIEAQALSSIAKKISDAIKDIRAVKKGEDVSLAQEKRFRDSISLNWRLWTIFQSELLSEDNVQPKDITENLLKLASFIDSSSVIAMSKTDLELAETIININRNIAAGLLEVPKKQNPAMNKVSDLMGKASNE